MVAARILMVLGWSLAMENGVQEMPRPFLSLHPSTEVALGDTVALRCRVPRPGVWVVVFKEGDGKYQWQQDEAAGAAEVSLQVTTRGVAGRYRCGYEIPASSWYSALSSPVELVVLDPRYPPPTMSLRPSRRVRPGTNVTIQCHSTHGATFILHKARSSVPIQRQRLVGGHAATFIIPRVTRADAGTYGCSYRPQRLPFISSYPRAEVTLEVAPAEFGTPSPPPSSPDFTLGNTVRLALGAAVLLLLAMVGAEALQAHRRGGT